MSARNSTIATPNGSVMLPAFEAWCQANGFDHRLPASLIALHRHLQDVTHISGADRNAARKAASSGQLYTHPQSLPGGLLGDEIRRLSRLGVDESECDASVITFGGSRRDDGDSRGEGPAGLNVGHQLAHLGHVPALGNDDLDGHVDGQPDHGLGQCKLGYQSRFSRLVHLILRDVKARIKALLRGRVE